MVSEGVDDWCVREMSFEGFQSDVDGSQIGGVILSPHIMRRKIPCHVAVG